MLLGVLPSAWDFLESFNHECFGSCVPMWLFTSNVNGLWFHDLSHRVIGFCLFFFPSWQNWKVVKDWGTVWYIKYLMLYGPETSKQYSVVLDTLHKKQLHLRQLLIVSLWSSWCMVAFCRLFFSLIAGTKTELRFVICGWILIFKNCNGYHSGGLFHLVGKYLSLCHIPSVKLLEKHMWRIGKSF